MPIPFHDFAPACLAEPYRGQLPDHESHNLGIQLHCLGGRPHRRMVVACAWTFLAARRATRRNAGRFHCCRRHARICSLCHG